MRTTNLPLLFLLIACTDDPVGAPTPTPAGPIEEPVPEEEEEEVENQNDWPQLPDLDAAIVEIMEESHIPGLSACIISAADVVWCGGYGWANIEEELPVAPDTPFMLASISKLFTATALMVAWESELFELDDSVADVLDFPFAHPEDDTPITHRQLLSHVGGVRDNWNVMNQLYVDGDSPIALGDFLRDYYDPEGAYYDQSQNWVPDGVEERMVYANMGYALLGHLVEQLTGEQFPEFCQREIFDPLGMYDTAWHLADLDESQVAMPYVWRNGDYQSVGHYGYPDYPNGALRTGAEQLARFMAMGMGGGEYRDVRILEEETFVEMITTQYPDLDPTQGLGWYTWNFDGETVWGHNGGDSGVATEAGIRWTDEHGFVILMNSEGTRWDTLENLEVAIFEAAQAL